MLYLEDYLEMIEHLPQELRDRFTEMREMDLQVHNAMDNLEDQAKQFFSNAKRMKVEQREIEFDKIKQEYYKILEETEEKVHLASQIYELVERYLKRLDQELQKFKIELEADNSGITEILEKRSYELDNPVQPAVNHVREKRKYTFHNSSGPNASSSSINNSSYMSGHGVGHLHHERQMSNDKVFTTIAQELNQSMANASASSNTPSSGVISSSNITNSRLSCNSFTPLLSVVSANNTVNDRVAGTAPSFLPHGSFRLGNNAIAAAASQAIAATQQMQQGRRTASLKASYEAINSGYQSLCGLTSMRDPMTFDSISSSHAHDMASHTFPSTSSSSGTSSAMGFDMNRGSSSSGRMNKKNRTSSSHFGDASSNLTLHNSLYGDDSSEGLMPAENNESSDHWPYDPNEPRYCICNHVSYGDMVACDNEDCEKEWFHYGCVGISQPPKGKWYCPDCSDRMNKRKRKERA